MLNDPAERTLTELVSRHLTLAVHGVLGVEVGVAMILTGSPPQIEEWFGPWARVALGSSSLLAGALIILGIILTEVRMRGWLAMLAGCIGLAIWHFTMAASYIVIAATAKIDVAPLGQPVASDALGRPYIPFIYLTLLILISVQVHTLARVGRPVH